MSAMPALIIYIRNASRFSRMNEGWVISYSSPCLHDRHDDAGVANGHYFHQDLYVASRIYEAAPERHIDVGSRIDGFVAHVASFREVCVFDIRKIKNTVENIRFETVDIMDPPDHLANSADSVSCLHALEHFGLGRYGDRLDPGGHIQGLEALFNILKENGTLYLSVPIGLERIEYDAHRVFHVKSIIDLCDQGRLVDFAWVDDAGVLHKISDLERIKNEKDMGLSYGLGIFTFKKIVKNDC